MDIDQQLTQLQQITPVEAPPFLLTRIKQQLLQLPHSPAPILWKWRFATAALVLMLINGAILFSSSNQVTAKNSVEQMVRSMQLSTNNDLYHE